MAVQASLCFQGFTTRLGALCFTQKILIVHFSSSAVQKEPTQGPVQSNRPRLGALFNRLHLNHHRCSSFGRILWSYRECFVKADFYFFYFFLSYVCNGCYKWCFKWMKHYYVFQNSDRTVPVLIIGIIVFLPGIYHLRIAYYASKGYPGYSYDDIPDFDDWTTPKLQLLSYCTCMHSCIAFKMAG